MASFYDRVPGYNAAVAAETLGRDAAYLRLPLRVVGLVDVRPLTLRDYLRLSAERSPFVAGGEANKDDACFLLWYQRCPGGPEIDPPAFARLFDLVDLDGLTAACGELVDRAMFDAPKGGNGKGGYYSIAAMLVTAFRSEFQGMTKAEVLDTPLDELWQEYKAIQQRRDPRTLLFNPSDRLKSLYARQLGEEELAAKQAAARSFETP